MRVVTITIVVVHQDPNKHQITSKNQKNAINDPNLKLIFTLQKSISKGKALSLKKTKTYSRTEIDIFEKVHLSEGICEHIT